MSVTITRFHWVRHAPVKSMLSGRIYGQRDVGCDLRDTERLAVLADNLPTDAIWVTSTLSRTKKTARAIAAQREEKLTLLPYKRLMEQNFGLWQSKTWDELEDDPESQAFWDDPAGHRPPEGESFVDLCQRVHKCIHHLADKYAGQDLVCVTHAGTIRAAVALALDLPPAMALRLQLDTLSLSRIDRIVDTVGGNNWAVGCLNN